MTIDTLRWAVVGSFACVFLSVACGGGDDQQPTEPTGREPEVTTVTVSPDSAKLTETGATQDFDATARDQTGNEMSGVSFNWSVSSPSVASIDDNGTVTARAHGTTSVEAEADGVTGTSQLIAEIEGAEIISPDSATAISAGEELRLKGTATDENGDTIPASQLTWSSDIDGTLGEGTQLATESLSVETHWIVLEARENSGEVWRDSVTVLVKASKDSIERAPTARDTAAGFAVDQVLIRYQDDSVSTATQAEINREYDLTSQRYISDLGLYVAQTGAGSDSTVAIVRRLRNDPLVSGSALDILLRPSAVVPPDFRESPSASSLYHHRLTGTDLFWRHIDRSAPGVGSTVAVIETSGFDLSHPEFSGENKIQSPAFIAGKWGYQLGRSKVVDSDDDENLHGTWTASLAVGRGSNGNALLGVAPGANLIPIRIGEGYWWLTGLARAIEYARKKDADVINISLGPANKSYEEGTALYWSIMATVGPVAFETLNQGTEIVVASMNSGLNIDEVNALVRADERIWVVGGSNKEGTDRFRKGPGETSQSGPNLDLIAPGVDLCGARSGGGRRCTVGTSGSAPIVSGLIALYRSTGLSVQETRSRLEKRTIDLAGDGSGLGTDGPDHRTGRGRVIAGIEIDSLRPRNVPTNQSTVLAAYGRNFGRRSELRLDGQAEPAEFDKTDGDSLRFSVSPNEGTLCFEIWLDHQPSTLTSNRIVLPVGDGVGCVALVTRTEGNEQDQDGYQIAIEKLDTGQSVASPSVAVRDSVLADPLDQGSYRARITDVRDNCTADEQEQRFSVVPDSTLAVLRFEVTCSDVATGELEVIVSTSGEDQDTDGYSVLVDGSDRTDIGVNDTVVISGLEAQDHEVELSGIQSNCSADGDNPRTVNVQADQTVSTSFSVSCAAQTGNLEVSASTSGENQDSDGYTVTVDGSQSKSIGPNGTSTFTDLPTGDHETELSGIQANCSVDGNNPRTVSVVADSTTMTEFNVACSDTSSVNGPIAFDSRRNSDGDIDIYVMDGDRTNLTRLTNHPDSDRAPEWSSSAGKYVFESSRTISATDIYVMNADGSGVSNLTQEGTISDSDPAWSPDGSKIAFVSDRDDQFGDIYVMNSDGSNIRRLTNNSASDAHPTWSSDGSKIAFESGRDGGDADIYLMNTDGSGVTRLTSSPYGDIDPAWSPSGSKIAFASSRGDNPEEIYVMNSDGSGITQITSDAARDFEPAWSPNGGQIAFYSKRDGNYDIYVINTDGTGLTRFTTDSEVDSSPTWR